jgi:5-methylcytosine-specific restriction endonuclease McrA
MIKICNVCNTYKEHRSWKAYTCNECLDNGMKYCPACARVMSISDFHKNGTTLRSFCKSCENRRSIVSKESTGYYARPEVKAKRNEDSRLCKQAKYKFDAEYRAAEIIRCHERRELVTELSVSPLQWLEIVAQFNGVCAYCGSPHNLTMDHVVPISKGGKTTIDNVIPACSSCNSSKQARDIIEWYTSQPFYSKNRLDNIIKFVTTRR